MAGIGFRLQKILSKDSYTDLLKAYLYSAIISSGPWLMTIIVVGIIGSFSNILLNENQSDLFRVTIVYTYAFSLIFIGIIQMIVTRYLADKLYISEQTLIQPIFNSSLLIVLMTSVVFIVVFYLFSSLPLYYCIISIQLFFTISILWLCMIFLSAAKDYNSITFAFIFGSIISILSAIILTYPFGVAGTVAGFSLGQFIIVILLLSRIIIEFPSDTYFDFGFIKYFTKHYELFLIGFLYNIAIWIDKIIFWYFGPGEKIKGLFYTYKIYDSSMFFAYVTVVPSLALFLIRIETSFYRSYKKYFATIINKAPLSIIKKEHDNLCNSLKLSFERLIKLQGFFSFSAIIFADRIIDFFNLSYTQFSILRIGILGAFLNVIFMIFSIILMYFDLKLEALISTLVFLISNIVFTFLTLKFGFAFYGYGYFSACLISLPVAYYFLNKNLNNLEYITFMKQPITNPDTPNEYE